MLRNSLPAVYFSTTKSSDRQQRRLLIISYYFPPINVVGALRWQKLASYAAERGWGIDVILAEPSSTPHTVDSARLATLPPDTTLFAVADHGSWTYELQRWVWRSIRPLVRRGNNVPTPPAEEVAGPPTLPTRAQPGAAYLSRMYYEELRRWSRDVARVGSRIASVNRTEFIISSGPPQSTHFAARLISRRTGIPWLMDMRDPWCSIEVMPRELASRTWLELATRHEARCVRDARLVSVTTEALRRDLASRYPDIADRFLTVMNGADPMIIPEVERPPRFTIAYAGNLYVGRDPRNLFRAVARVAQDLDLTPNDLGIEFMGGGDFARQPIVEIAGEIGVAEFVTTLPLQPHDVALKFQARASMLVSLPQYAHLAIPAKLFEYVQYNAWLLVLAEKDSATELVFRNSGADVAEPSDVDAIAAIIRRRFEQYRRGERARAVNSSGEFDRARQAQILLDAIEAAR